MIGVARAVFTPEVEAAMLSTFGVDPLTAGLPRVARLVKKLPPGAFPYSDTRAAWSMESHLLASLIEQVEWLAWLTAAVNSKKKPKKPKPFPRPGDKAKKQKKVSWADAAQVMGGS